MWFWAKLGTNQWPSEYHPVVCHLIDVGRVTEALWKTCLRPPVRRRVARQLGLTEDGAGKWVSFWVAAHDIGKLTPCFQLQGKTDTLKARLAGGNYPTAINGNSHHTDTGTFVLHAALAAGAKPLADALARKVAVCVGGHHGLFPTDWTRAEIHLGGDPWAAARADLLARLAGLFGVSDLDPPCTPDGADQSVWMVLAGLTAVADWIGSNETHFPRIGTPELVARPAFDVDDYFRTSGEQTEAALKAIGWGTRPQPTANPLSFEKVTGIARPRALQEAVIPLAETMAASGEPRLLIVEAPMGEGKTEAAWYAADCWDRCGGAGTYVALPTMATSNQMFDRVKEFLARRDGRSNLTLLHGKSALNDRFEQLKFAARTYDPDGSPSGVVAEGWFAANKKQGLLAPFGVGTIDQALLAVLQTKHAFVRLFGLAGKCVILDEVHAYDAYMTTLMERLLTWLAALGCPVVLLSATLPADKRTRLLRAYAGPDTTEPEYGAYPRVTSVAVGGVPAVKPFAADETRKMSLALEWVTDAALVEKLRADMDAGRCAAVIRNTVGLAQDTFETLRKEFAGTEVVVELFHARFPFGRRQAIEDAVLARFGKTGGPAERTRRILVATQVVEQSLDLDFDAMYTDVAPADLVLQRAGRLHRHARGDRVAPVLHLIEPGVKDDRPDFGPYERKSGRGVYDRHVLLRSLLELMGRSTISLPDDIDDVVKAVYHDAVPVGPTEWGDDLIESKKVRTDEANEDCKAAQSFAILEPGEEELLDSFSRDLRDDEDPRIPPGRQAVTRLAQPTIQVVLLYETARGLALDADGSQPVNLYATSTLSSTRNLLCNAVALSHQPVVAYYTRRDAPDGWTKNGMLRYHRVVRLTVNGDSAGGEYPLSYSSETGVRFVRAEEELE